MPTLRRYQADDAIWLSKQKRAFLLLQQRLGKTPVSIRACNLVGARRVMIICEAVGRIGWRKEFRRWSLDRKVKVFVQSFDYVSRGNPLPVNIDVLIIDEAQKLKAKTSKRTKVIYGKGCNGDGLIARAKRVWVLSGTLCPNGAHEMYTHLRALFPERLPKINGQVMDNWRWNVRLFYTREQEHGTMFFGPKPGTLKLIQGMLKGIVRRRTKKQVMPELPGVEYADAWVSSDDVVEELNKHPDIIEAHEQINDSLLMYGDLSAINTDDEHIATARKLIGIAKAPLVAEFTREMLESGAFKVIVFAWHRDVLDILAEKLKQYRPVMIRGGVPDKKRQRAITSFMDPDDPCRVFLGQLTSAGTTITLPIADNIVFAESSWVPSDNAQAAFRADHIDRTTGVLASFVALDKSIDVAVMRTARKKAEQLDELWNFTGAKAA